jgi:hypothetical protein
MTNIFNWTQELALSECVRIEHAVSCFGLHVALTGGCLYKIGPRKDLDIIIYRHHGADECSFDRFRAALSTAGIVLLSQHSNVLKMQNSDGRSIDILLRAISWPETLSCSEGTSDSEDSAAAKEKVALDCITEAGRRALRP